MAGEQVSAYPKGHMRSMRVVPQEEREMNGECGKCGVRLMFYVCLDANAAATGAPVNNLEHSRLLGL